MNFVAHQPTELLAPYIKQYLFIESTDDLVNRVLPGTAISIAFRYRGQVNYFINDSKNNLPVSVISGLRKSPRLFNYTVNSGNLVVIFKETGAAAFFNHPLHELFEESISLDYLISQQETSIIEEQLAEASNHIQRITLVEQFLLSKLDKSTPDKLISAAIHQIHSTKGFIKIKQLANSLYISHDAFEKRFRKTVGASPKQFASIVRMNFVIKEKTKSQNLTNIAFDAGYFDQSHFIKSFKLFTGQTPTDFFKSPPLW